MRPALQVRAGSRSPITYTCERKAMEEGQTKKAMNKTEILNVLAEATGLTKGQVQAVFSELSTLIAKKMSADGPGTFAVPDLMQIKVVRKPATAERRGSTPSPRKR